MILFRTNFTDVIGVGEHSPFGADKGNVSFSIDAPKTIDGKDMVLHYMAGKHQGCVHSVLFVWAEMPLSSKDVRLRAIYLVTIYDNIVWRSISITVDFQFMQHDGPYEI